MRCSINLVFQWGCPEWSTLREFAHWFRSHVMLAIVLSTIHPEKEIQRLRQKLHINFIACSPALYKRISGLEDVWSRIKHYFQLPTFRGETWWKTYPPGKLHNHLLQDLGHGIVYKMMPSGGEIHIVTCQNNDAQINSGNIINYNKYFIIPIFIFICMG